MAERWNYRVFWSPEDGEYVAVPEHMPSLSALHADPVRALRELVKKVEPVARQAEAEEASRG